MFGSKIFDGTSAVLSRDLRRPTLMVSHAGGMVYHLESGRQIVDACGGSAVACLGHDNARIRTAINRQLDRVPYCHSSFFTTPASEILAKKVIDTTGGKMARLLTLSSGSEALEAALKMARQYYLELPQPEEGRARFISRQPSYHGATLQTLEVGGHLSRRAPFEPILAANTTKISQCNIYRGLHRGESVQQYVRRLAAELDEKFCALPQGTVAAFVAEPVTGASTGSVPAPEGYFAAMKQVCEAHGALLIMDEVMCGMGRTGTMHAWQQEGVVPNIQVIGKAFGGGYVPISGILIDHKVNDVLKSGSARFSHGQSFQAHPTACAAALEVQNIIEDENLLSNVQTMGHRLSKALRSRLGRHPFVGQIRGRGLFWSVEFVRDKLTKLPFPPGKNVGYSLHEFALQDPYSVCVYPGSGTVDGSCGDHILLAPPYNVTANDIDNIVERVSGAISDFFEEEEKGINSDIVL